MIKTSKVAATRLANEIESKGEREGHTGIPGIWTQVLDAGFWTLDSGQWTLGAGLWTLNHGHLTLDSGR